MSFGYYRRRIYGGRGRIAPLKMKYLKQTSASGKKFKDAVKKIVLANIETKEKVYPYTALPAMIGGGTVSLASVSYGTGAILAGLGRGITQSAADDGRIGNQIKISRIRFYLPVQNGDASEINNLRFVVFTNKDQMDLSSLSTSVTQILSGATSSGSQWCNPIDTDVFTVYKDKNFYIRPQDISAAAARMTKFVKFTLKFKNPFIVQWDSQLTEPRKDIMVLAISDSALVAHPGAICGYIKVSYKDA